MKQKQITTIAGLVAQGGVLVGAATDLGAILGLHHNTNDKILADLTDLIMAVGGYEQAKTDLYDRRTALKASALTARTHLRKGRDVLKPIFGYTYSDLWTQLGYNDTLKITDDPDDQRSKLQSLKTYYAAHPTFEIPALELTATATLALLESLTAAQNAVFAGEGAVEAAMNVRDEKAENMRSRISGLIGELSDLMDPLDPRWLNFGLNMPGADETPDQVTGVKVTLIGPTAAAVKWEASARAQYYRVYTKVHGVEGDPVPVGSPGDLDFTIENLPPNATIDVIVRAVNSGGESPVSEVISVTTHA